LQLKGNMPKKMSRDKRGTPSVRTAASVKSTRIHSVKELLGRASPALTRVTQHAARQHFWSAWLCRHLPTELAAQVSGIVERGGTLIVFAASAAWCARLRYALQELEAPLHEAAPELAAVQVRVRPRA
jgi:hypothetical protein